MSSSTRPCTTTSTGPPTSWPTTPGSSPGTCPRCARQFVREHRGALPRTPLWNGSFRSAPLISERNGRFRWERPTPCEKWTVTQVLQHAIGDQIGYAAAIVGGPRPSEDPFAPSGRIDGDPAVELRAALGATGTRHRGGTPIAQRPQAHRHTARHRGAGLRPRAPAARSRYGCHRPGWPECGTRSRRSPDQGGKRGGGEGGRGAG
ncbi:maleylpyruvate isomerase N-terminal domain-containing protein [Micromonospora rubida]|uniref:maleylpyruvate isomerase N-terminal domain-containing protein n=1 Tax=Micromonospora rubida TaxID=2697657 RepID=UPI002E2BD788|nr:maleylpyruvate isomerase N-terminal domain-containing protein [Micromonospora rubida]